MSIRDGLSGASLPKSHYFISLAHGESMRTLAARPIYVWTLLALFPLSLLWGGAATAYIAFHDEMIGAYLAHTAEMQNAYEDRLAEARAELDRVASRQLLDQTSFEGKMHDLLTRQARLEQRGSIVAALATEVDAHPQAHAQGRPQDSSQPRAGAKPASGALSAIEAAGRSGATDNVLGPSTRAFAPTDAPSSPAAAPKPRPLDDAKENLSAIPRATFDKNSTELAAAAENPNLDASARLGLIDYSLDRVERGQLAALGRITSDAQVSASRLGAVVAKTGLSVDELAPANAKGGLTPKGGLGGPFIPLTVDAAAPAFDAAVARAAREVELSDRLKKLMVYMPVREPLLGEASVSSPFGYRADPFLGRPALHPGVDLVQPFGSDIRATAAGKVVHAGWMGGYGEMVEIDHGNGLATRYGHMSEVLVSEGDEVKSGTVLGHIGSTGRSTGPHLHYEVRVDGEPVDPERFLTAGEGLKTGQE